jgi:alkylation response protein AidB-like acyl-CoA dehydrogenase
MEPSSSTTGFFQAPPTLAIGYSATAEHLADDNVLSRILSLYLPDPILLPLQADLHAFARLCLHPDTLGHAIDAEVNPPTLHPLTAFGAPNTLNPLKTGEGWRALTKINQREGMVSLGFEKRPGINARLYHFVKLALWQGSAGMVTCPTAMTDGAAVLLGRHLEDADVVKRRVFREVRRRLVSRDPTEAWTSGQWMTERKGGSDVSGTETVAFLLPPSQQTDYDKAGMPLGPYSISGFKWFSSATDSDCAILLAKTRPELGVSVFFAPMRLGDGTLNGVRIQRLKNKMGTKPVPTAELELKGMRGWMIGEEGRGVKEISAILNITRLHTGIANVGYWGRGLAVSRGYSRVRTISRGRNLEDDPHHCAWMAGEVVKYTAATNLVLFGAALLGASEQGRHGVEGTFADQVGLIPKSKDEVDLLLRIMTPLLKGQTTLAGTAGLRACMESLGGIGYLENNETPELNIARLFRDSVVSSIWEGTTSVMAEDVMRVLKGKTAERAMAVLAKWVYDVWTSCSKIFADQEHVFKASWVAFKAIVGEKETEELLFMGREVLDRLEGIVCALLLMADAVRDQSEMALEVARRWCRSRVGSDPHEQREDWKKTSQMDKRIFLGGVEVAAALQSKL